MAIGNDAREVAGDLTGRAVPAWHIATVGEFIVAAGHDVAVRRMPADRETPVRGRHESCVRIGVCRTEVFPHEGLLDRVEDHVPQVLAAGRVRLLVGEHHLAIGEPGTRAGELGDGAGHKDGGGGERHTVRDGPEHRAGILPDHHGLTRRQGRRMGSRELDVGGGQGPAAGFEGHRSVYLTAGRSSVLQRRHGGFRSAVDNFGGPVCKRVGAHVVNLHLSREFAGVGGSAPAANRQVDDHRHGVGPGRGRRALQHLNPVIVEGNGLCRPHHAVGMKSAGIGGQDVVVLGLRPARSSERPTIIDVRRGPQAFHDVGFGIGLVGARQQPEGGPGPGHRGHRRAHFEVAELLGKTVQGVEHARGVVGAPGRVVVAGRGRRCGDGQNPARYRERVDPDVLLAAALESGRYIGLLLTVGNQGVGPLVLEVAAEVGVPNAAAKRRIANLETVELVVEGECAEFRGVQGCQELPISKGRRRDAPECEGLGRRQAQNSVGA